MMAALSLTKAEMDAIRFAADMVDSFREGADEEVVANWPMAELGKVREKMRAAARRRRARVS